MTTGQQTSITEKRLAPHETIEMNELLFFNTNELFKLKTMVDSVTDPEQRQFYLQTIQATERHMSEIINLLQNRSFINF